MKITFALSAPLLVLASIAAASTVYEAKQDIIAIDSAVVNLQQHTAVQSLNYFNGLAIKQAADDLTATLTKGATCVQQLREKPTEKDAMLMLQTLTKTEVRVKSVVDQMIRLKSGFENLGVISKAQESVKEFQKQTKAFASQLVNLAAPQEHTAAQALAAKLNQDLDRCNAAYTGETQAMTAPDAGRQTAPVSRGRTFGQPQGAVAALPGSAQQPAGVVSQPNSKLTRKSRLSDQEE